MGRRLTGSVRRRGARWLASVPRTSDPTKRMECAFSSEAEATEWLAVQRDRLAEGLEPEKPPRQAPEPVLLPAPAPERPTSSPSAVPSLAVLAASWHHEWYEELENAGPDRSAEVRRILELHVVPPFAHLLGTDVEVGRAMVKDWLRALSGRQPLTKGSAFAPSGKVYAHETAGGYLWLLRQVLGHARDLGYTVPNYAEGRGIGALHPLGRPKKRRAPLVSVADAAAIAGQLHVVHQSVLWLLRLCGFRISESYGLLVADFFVDPKGDGFIVSEAQGGKKFRQRTAKGEVEVVTHKKAQKTDSAYRLIALPAPLTALLLQLVEAFHTDAKGTIDPTARLVPAIRAEGGGQEGFRSALRSAALAVGGAEEEASYRVVPHDFRKSFATDLAWAAEVSGLAARRAMGHRVGSDVFDLVYTLDSRLKEHLVPVARQIEREIATAGLATLMVPTAKRPVYSHDADPERVAYADRRLESAGWQVASCGELLGVHEVAALCGLDARAARRLFPDKIRAVKIAGVWRCTEADAVAFAERLAGCTLLTEVAGRASVDYHTAYRTMGRLGIDPKPDEATRTLMLSVADGERIVAELDRIERLQARSVTAARAAAMLRTSESMVHYWARRGRLAYDTESDGRRGKFVSRASVEALVAERGGRRQPMLAVAEFKAMTGFTDADVRALVAAKLLLRAGHGRLTPESVWAWAAGHRPALLTDSLLMRYGLGAAAIGSGLTP